MRAVHWPLTAAAHLQEIQYSKPPMLKTVSGVIRGCVTSVRTDSPCSAPRPEGSLSGHNAVVSDATKVNSKQCVRLNHVHADEVTLQLLQRRLGISMHAF